MMVFGTPRYMSPEQCKSATNIDHRSDIYTLGCILFELVCGKLPFDGQAGELIAKHQLVEPPRVSKFADVPPELDALINQMLAKEPADRPQTMALVQRALIASGAESSGSAATLHPEALSSSRSHGTPRTFGVPPSLAVTAPPGSPTTLSGATGASRIAPRSKTPYVVIGVLAAAGVTGGILLATHKRPEATHIASAAVPTPQLDAAPAVVVTPILADAAVPEVVIDAAEAHADPTPPPPPPPPQPVRHVVIPTPLPAPSINIGDVAINLAHGCFDRFAKTHAPITGSLKLQVHVDLAGRGTVKASGLVADIEDCVTRKFATWKFPRARVASALDVNVPYQSSVTADKVPDKLEQKVEPKDEPKSEPKSEPKPRVTDCIIKDKVVDPFNKTPCPQ